MANLFDYLEWRGDLPLDKIPVNEIDGLIFSQLSYVCWEDAAYEPKRIRLKDLRGKINPTFFRETVTIKEDQKFLPMVTESPRFGEVRIEDTVAEFDEDEEKQFSATTFLLPDETVFIAYRGTDNTQIGWKEDFNMTFMPLIPSQIRALEYLTEIAERYPNPIRVGGHSKGGNLAVYAAIAAEEKIQDRILAVYCHDGPGYNENVKPVERYDRIKSRIQPVVPQSSVIGMLLLHLDNYKIVHSTASGIYQHDPYTWEIKGGAFAEESALKEDSKFTQNVIKKWLSKITLEDRRILINAMFDIVGAANIKTFGAEFWTSLFRNPLIYINAIQNLDESSRNLVSNALGSLAKSAFAMIGDKNQEPQNLDKA